MKKDYAQWFVLALFLVSCFVAAALGAWLTGQSINDWYRAIEKPSWTPPDSVFAPVWTFLYLSMAMSGWLVWRRRGFAGAKAAFVGFFLQLVLNVCWSGAFFALKNPPAGLVVLVLLWWVILGTLVAFWRIHRLAGALLIPYLLWLTFAGALNHAVWQLNA